MLVETSATQEQALIELAKQQDEDAFRKLYDAYLPAIFAYVASRAQQQCDAEDIVQNAFSKVVHYLPDFEYRGAGSFQAWLFTIASSQISDFYARRIRSNGQVPLDELSELPSQSMSAEEIADLNMLIEKLSSRGREVLRLKLQGISNRDIAAALGLDERTVSSHFRKGLRELAKLYRGET